MHNKITVVMVYPTLATCSSTSDAGVGGGTSTSRDDVLEVSFFVLKEFDTLSDHFKTRYHYFMFLF
jgi:hypothetical protein